MRHTLVQFSHQILIPGLRCARRSFFIARARKIINVFFLRTVIFMHINHSRNGSGGDAQSRDNANARTFITTATEFPDCAINYRTVTRPRASHPRIVIRRRRLMDSSINALGEKGPPRRDLYRSPVNAIAEARGGESPRVRRGMTNGG